MAPVTVNFAYQTSPHPCVDANGYKGCGAKAGEPCVLRPTPGGNTSSRYLAGKPRATLHAHRQRGPLMPQAETATAEWERQPAPVANDHPPIVPQVIADLEARMAHGVKTYGVALQPGNGRDALRDLYEELLDACCYIKQVMEERDRGELKSLRAENAELRAGQDRLR